MNFSRKIPGAQTGCAGKLLLAIISTVLMLFLAEVFLRSLGYHPGIHVKLPFFEPVDTLYLLKGFEADSNGIHKVSRVARTEILAEMSSVDQMDELPPIKDDQVQEVYFIKYDYMQLRDEVYKSPFKTFLNNLPTPKDSGEAEIFNAIKNYVQGPINSDGFKSIEFKKYNKRRKSILLLGDSFTWGHSASNVTNCFGDILLTKNYVVYNTGITATDPAQYLQIAKVLIPKLDPDFVIVNFYMGNDVLYFKREVKPYQLSFFSTNAGNLMACPQGIYLKDEKQAYEYGLAFISIPKGRSKVNEFASKTVLTTLIWGKLREHNLVDAYILQYKDYFDEVDKVKTETPYSEIEVAEIKKLSEENGSKFFLAVIPLWKDQKFFMPENIPGLFSELEYHVPPVQKKHYFDYNDGHYNDAGHAMHADFLDSLIKAHLQHEKN